MLSYSDTLTLSTRSITGLSHPALTLPEFIDLFVKIRLTPADASGKRTAVRSAGVPLSRRDVLGIGDPRFMLIDGCRAEVSQHHPPLGDQDLLCLTDDLQLHRIDSC